MTLPPLWAITGALAVAGGVATYVQGVRLDAAKAELAVCSAAYNQALASIAKQNKGVKYLQEASQKAQERAKAALLEARRGADTSKAEVARLKAELGKKTVTGCSAAEGVKVVRDGLK